MNPYTQLRRIEPALEPTVESTLDCADPEDERQIYAAINEELYVLSEDTSEHLAELRYEGKL